MIFLHSNDKIIAMHFKKHNIYKYILGKERKHMLSIKWDITYKCNLNCNHCLRGEKLNLKEKEISYNDLKIIIDKLKENGLETIHFLGGEPIFRKDFKKITDYLKNKKILFGFNTNGLLLDRKNIIEIIIKNEYLRNIVISLEGPNEEINDKIRGKNVFNIVVQKIKSIVKLKNENNLKHLKLTINTVVSKLNYKYISEMIEMSYKIGVQQINLLGLVNEGNSNDQDFSLNFDEEVYLMEEIGAQYKLLKNKIEIVPRFLMPIAKEYSEKILKIEIPKIKHGCGAGTMLGFIDNKGLLYPCDRFESLILDKYNKSDVSLVRKSFNEIWSKYYFDLPFELTEGYNFYNKYITCKRCTHLKKNCYPCPVPGYHLNNEMIKFPKCENYLKEIESNEVK